MQYFILAAGKGTRLKDLTLKKPKTLLDLGNGEDILGFQTRIIRTFDKQSEIYVVSGYRAEAIREKYPDLREIYNPHFEDMNNIYSVYLIKDFAKGDFIIINGDTVFHPFILKRLLERNSGTYCVVDNVKALSDEEMKVVIEDGKITRFGKDIPPDKADGEYIGLTRFNPLHARVLFSEIEDMLNKGYTQVWYENAFSRITDKVRFIPLFTNDLLWTEVDNIADYKRAKEIIWKFSG